VHGELGGDAGEPVDEVAAAQHIAGDPVAAVRVAELRGGQVPMAMETPSLPVWYPASVMACTRSRSTSVPVRPGVIGPGC
jgi:hypothetical protein